MSPGRSPGVGGRSCQLPGPGGGGRYCQLLDLSVGPNLVESSRAAIIKRAQRDAGEHFADVSTLVRGAACGLASRRAFFPALRSRQARAAPGRDVKSKHGLGMDGVRGPGGAGRGARSRPGPGGPGRVNPAEARVTLKRPRRSPARRRRRPQALASKFRSARPRRRWHETQPLSGRLRLPSPMTPKPKSRSPTALLRRPLRTRSSEKARANSKSGLGLGARNNDPKPWNRNGRGRP